MLRLKGMYYPGLGDKVTGSATVYWVNSSKTAAEDGNPGTDPDFPLATLAQAVSNCSANDWIILDAGHTETISSTVAFSDAGVNVLGVGHGSQKPALTQGTSGSDNVIEIAAAGVTLDNIRFVGSTTGTSEVFIDVQGVDRVSILNCIFEQNTKNLEAITITSGTDDLLIEGCQFRGVAAGADHAIKFEDITDGANNDRPIIRNCVFNYIDSAGCDLGAICVSHSSGGTVGMLIENCNFIGIANGEAAVDPQKTSSGRCTGLMKNVNVHTADATDAFVQSDLLGMIDCYAVEAGTRPLGALGGSGMAPIATPAA